MKILFIIKHRISNEASVTNLQQPAKFWLGALIGAVGEQIGAGHDGVIGIDVDGTKFVLRCIEIPGLMETHRVKMRKK